MEWKFWLTGVISTVLIIFGFVGNACAMYILRKPKMRSAFNQLLIILCIIDSMFLLSNIPTTVMALGLRKYLQSIILKLKFIYSEKATKFYEIFTLLLSYVVPVKSKVKIS